MGSVFSEASNVMDGMTVETAVMKRRIVYLGNFTTVTVI